MEILFMVFMVVVSIMALFAVMVVFRDIVREILAERRERNNQNNNAAAGAACNADSEPARAPVEVGVPAVTEESATAEEQQAVEDATVNEAPEGALAEAVSEKDAGESAEEPEAVNEESVSSEDTKGTISFSLSQQQTLEEKYLSLTPEQRRWYDEIIKYASRVEGSKRFKNVRYEEYKVGKNRIVRLLIKRGVIHCEFILHNSDFKNYVNENKISVRQSATTMLVENARAVDAVKNSIDIVVAAIDEEKEYKKKLARERRRTARAIEKSGETNEEKTEANVGA